MPLVLDMKDSASVRLAVAIARRGTSQRQLADHLGVSPSSLSGFAKYGSPAGGVTWEKIAEALAVPVEALKDGGPWGPLVDLISPSPPPVAP